MNTENQVLNRAFQVASMYMDERRSRSPRASDSAGKLRQRFDIDLSDAGRDSTEVINDLISAAEGGLVGNTGPDFYGWVMGSSCKVGVAADILTSAWGQNAAIYQTAPSAAIAEEVAASWLLDLFGLPCRSSIAFTTGATMASYIGLASARSEILSRVGWNVERHGLFGAPEIPVVVSEEAHTSVLAVLRYLGFGTDHLICINTDEQGRMKTDEVAEYINQSELPGIIVAQAGHINSGAFDNIGEIATVVQKNGWWLHVDGAFGMWARCSSKVSYLAEGIDKADSWAVDGHKWLQVPYDSGYAIVKDSAAHKRAMSVDASYLNRDEKDGRNPSDFGPELSRRARGFATWAVLQYLGRRGIAEMIDRHCECAILLADQLSAIPGIHVLNEVNLNQVVLSFLTRDENTGEEINATDAVISAVQSEDISFVSGANWRGRRIMRISVIAGDTTNENVVALVFSITRAWRRVQLGLK